MADVTRAGSAPSPSIQEIDLVLTAQLAVAWAGEGGEEPRLAWWRSDLASEYGGEDLFLCGTALLSFPTQVCLSDTERQRLIARGEARCEQRRPGWKLIDPARARVARAL